MIGSLRLITNSMPTFLYITKQSTHAPQESSEIYGNVHKYKNIVIGTKYPKHQATTVLPVHQ